MVKTGSVAAADRSDATGRRHSSGTEEATTFAAHAAGTQSWAPQCDAAGRRAVDESRIAAETTRCRECGYPPCAAAVAAACAGEAAPNETAAAANRGAEPTSPSGFSSSSACSSSSAGPARTAAAWSCAAPHVESRASAQQQPNAPPSRVSLCGKTRDEEGRARAEAC